jgi:hypothetical protein
MPFTLQPRWCGMFLCPSTLSEDGFLMALGALCRPISATILVLLGGACTTRAPIALTLPNGTFQGTAVTTGYTGTLDAGGCRGDYTGSPASDTAPIELSCANGQRGSGAVVIRSGEVASGSVRLKSGGIATISPGLPVAPGVSAADQTVLLLRPAQQIVIDIGAIGGAVTGAASGPAEQPAPQPSTRATRPRS